MLCEKCTLEMDVVACGACGKSVAQLGPFCYHCGHKLENEAGMTAADAGRENDEVIDFSDRILCQRRDLHRRDQRAGGLQDMRKTVHAGVLTHRGNPCISLTR